MSQISASNTVGAALNRTSTNGFSEMSSEDFIRIMFTELSNQDPFQPNDSSALLDQLNSIRSIESDIELTSNLESLVFENKLGSAGNLLGKFVTGLSSVNDDAAGFVISVLRQGDELLLALDNGQIMPLDNVVTVEDASVYEDLFGEIDETTDGTGDTTDETSDVPDGTEDPPAP